jgi:hypothetical protein
VLVAAGFLGAGLVPWLERLAGGEATRDSLATRTVQATGSAPAVPDPTLRPAPGRWRLAPPQDLQHVLLPASQILISHRDAELGFSRLAIGAISEPIEPGHGIQLLRRTEPGQAAVYAYQGVFFRYEPGAVGGAARERALEQARYAIREVARDSSRFAELRPRPLPGPGPGRSSCRARGRQTWRRSWRLETGRNWRRPRASWAHRPGCTCTWTRLAPARSSRSSPSSPRTWSAPRPGRNDGSRLGEPWADCRPCSVLRRSYSYVVEAGRPGARPEVAECVFFFAVNGLLVVLARYSALSGLASFQIGALGALGYSLPERYRYPFLARSPADFWRRWNTYIGAWLKRYVFVPLARTLARSASVAMRAASRPFGVAATLLAIGVYHDVFVYAASLRWQSRGTLAFGLAAGFMWLWSFVAAQARRLRSAPTRPRASAGEMLTGVLAHLAVVHAAWAVAWVFTHG